MTAKTGAGKTGLFISMAFAIVTGNGEKIIGREVTKGRVAYISPENPDDARMRIMVAAFLLNVDLAEIGDDFVILDKRMKPEELAARLRALSADKPFSLIFIDTLAAFFDGDNINDPVQARTFMVRLRALTMLEGRPSVLVAAHPVKNASDDNLIPYGSGVILNEVDGNLTLSRSGPITTLHWQGKLRGVEFNPALFRFDTLGSPDVLDVKGRQVQLPMLRPTTEEEAESREQASGNLDAALLKAMADNPGGSIRQWGVALHLDKSKVERTLKRLAMPKAGKLVASRVGKWTLTKAGQKAIEGVAK